MGARTKRFSVTINASQYPLLQWLADNTNVYGTTPAEAAAYLINKGIDAEQRDGYLKGVMSERLSIISNDAKNN